MDSSSRGNKRVNLAISGWICIVIGSGVILGSGASGLSFAIATPISISGIVLLMAAIGMTNGDGLSIEEIRAWSPEGDLLPDAGGPNVQGRYNSYSSDKDHYFVWKMR